MSIYDDYHGMVTSSSEDRIKWLRNMTLKASNDRPVIDLPNGFKYFLEKNQLQIVFQSVGCRWNKQGSCVMCDYEAGSRNLKPNEINEAFRLIKRELGDQMKGDVLVLDAFGSVLDESEMPKWCFDSILKNVKALDYKVIVFETRPEFVTQSIIAKIKQALPDKIISFEFGIENEDFATNCRVPLGKEFACDWREKVKLAHQNNCLVTANVLIGVPFYSVLMRNRAAAMTIRVCEQYFDHIVLFPMNIKPHTLIWELHQEGSYEPITRWDIISVLDSLSPDSLRNIHLAYYGNKGPQCDIKPLDCSICHDDFEKFFESFMQDYDGKRRFDLVRKMVNGHRCSCKVTE